MNVAPLKDRAAARIDAASAALDGLALAIHGHPELGYEEHFASTSLSDYLVAQGHAVDRAPGGVDTAFVAEARHGNGPTIAICAEYDALAGIGHGCGHNLIARASLGAFLGVSAVAAELKGTVKLIGTPAEEGGAGKVRLHAAGVFDGVDAAMMFHPVAGTAHRVPRQGGPRRGIALCRPERARRAAPRMERDVRVAPARSHRFADPRDHHRRRAGLERHPRARRGEDRGARRRSDVPRRAPPARPRVLRGRRDGDRLRAAV